MKKILLLLLFTSLLSCANKSNATENNFTLYNFNFYSLSVPNTMELRNKSSIMAVGKQIFNNEIKNIIDVDIDNLDFVFQPTGIDNPKDIDERKKALALYARILISHVKGNVGDYLKWNDNIKHTNEEYNKMNDFFREELVQYPELIVNIENVKIGKNANKTVYVEQRYIRKGTNGNVQVVDYYLQNNSECVKLTVSYRISEKDLWEDDFNKILDSFSFKIKR